MGGIVFGENNPAWNGGKTNLGGYMTIRNTVHPRASVRGYVLEQILVLEKAWGRKILSTEEIHHIDGNPLNNEIGNLMVFKSHRMHKGYHQRLKAYQSSGHWDWRQCGICHDWDKPENLYITKDGRHARHRECHKKDMRDRRKNRIASDEY